MSAAEAATRRRNQKPSHDIYTALLGLALLALAGTAGFVCYRGWELFAAILRATGP